MRRSRSHIRTQLRHLPSSWTVQGNNYRSILAMLSDGLRGDLRMGLRVLAREKAFCALAVTVLALGIGGVTAMFSVVNGIMLRGLP